MQAELQLLGEQTVLGVSPQPTHGALLLFNSLTSNAGGPSPPALHKKLSLLHSCCFNAGRGSFFFF